MISSIETAILILGKWKSNSSKLRIVFENGHVHAAFHGEVESVADTSLVSLAGAGIGDELRFDLKGNPSISYIDSGAVPEGYEPLADYICESLVMAWEDGTRLSLLTEVQSAK